MMRASIPTTILSAFIALAVVITGLFISTQQAQAFSCKKVVEGQTIEMCCNQTGASCSSVFGTGWTGTCADISVSGICSSTDYETMCGPQADQQCVTPTGIADDPYCKAQRTHVTEDLTKILRVHGVGAPSSQPLDSVSVTVWFNKAQMSQLNKYGDKLGDPAWGSRTGDPLAGYVVYWTGKDDLQNMGDGLGREYELGYTTSALITGKTQRGYNFGNVLQFLQISDNDDLMKIRIRVQARSFKANAGYYCADPNTGRCEYKEDANGSLGFLVESSCQAECQRWCPDEDETGYNCVPRPAVNDAYYYVLTCSESDQACIDNRPDDWRKGSRSTWRNMTTIFDKVVRFDRYQCLPSDYPNQGNSNLTMKCLANQCNVADIPNSKFRFRLDNIVQPLAMYPGAITSFNLGFGFESTTGNDVYGNPGYYWSQADKFALRQFLGTPKYEGWYELRTQDGAQIDEVKCQRWNDLSISVPILDCPNSENLHYRLVYLVDQVGQHDRLSRFVDLWGYTPFVIPENNSKNDCTTPQAITAGNCKTTLASLSEFLRVKGWLERRVTFNASMTIPISLGGTESYWVNYENNGVQMTSLKPVDLCSDCEGPPVQCKNPIVQTGGHLFEREGGTFKPIAVTWVHDGKNDTATKTFVIEIDSLADVEIPVQVNESSVVEYQHIIPSGAVQTLFNYMQANNLDKIPITITGKTGTTDVCPASDTIMIEKPPTKPTYGCTNDKQCIPMAAGTYLDSNCNNECPGIDPNGYSCVGPGGACQEVVGEGEYATSNCNNACPVAPENRYGCNVNDQCVLMVGGTYTDSGCNNACPTVDEDRYGCNVDNQCVSMAGGGFATSDCNNACQCVGDDCVPGSEVRVSFDYVTDTTSCSAQTPPESGVVGKYTLHSNSVTAPISTSPNITLGAGPTAVTTGIPVSELRKATVGYTNPGYFCNACNTSGGFTGLCTAPVLTSNPDVFEFRVSVQHISSLLNSWWQSVGGRTYGLSVSSAVPNATATALLPDYDETNKEATDQYLTRSPGWTKSPLGGFLLANTITFRDVANPFGVPKPFTTERDNTQTHASGLDGAFVNLTLPQRTNDASTSMYNYFAHELDLEANGDLIAPTSAWKDFNAIKAGATVDDPGGGNDYWLVDVQGDLTIDPDTTINVADGENIILMVNGRVTIKGLDTTDPYKVISVAPDALLLVIASGDITIDEKVGETIEISTDINDPPSLTESSTRTATKKALEGMFLSDGTITIKSNNNDTVADKRFVGAGSFVGKSGVVMEREFSKEGMGPEQKINGRLLYGYTPTEIFFHRPDMVLNLPLVLHVGILQYQEVL